jgi:hypothetical protein
LDIHCNAGVATTNLVGDFPGYGTVWYHPRILPTSCLSLACESVGIASCTIAATTTSSSSTCLIDP